MNYIPGRVYRHKSRMGKKYRKAARLSDLLFNCASVAIMAVFVVLFVGWWIA